MNYSHEVQKMMCVKQGPNHGPAPIPEEGNWVKVKEISDISGLSHGVGWCAPQQGACKLTLNVKNGIIEEALVETLGCSGMTHSAAMAAEILGGKTLLEAQCVRYFYRSYTAERNPHFLRTDFRSGQVWKISEKDFAPRWEQCTAQRKKACVSWKWQKVMY